MKRNVLNRYIFLTLSVFIIAIFGVVCGGASDAHAKISFSSNNIAADTINLTYDGYELEYNGVMGSLYYNHKDIALTTMPIINTGGALYAPADELLGTVFGFDIVHDENTGSYTATDSDASVSVSYTVGEKKLAVSVSGSSADISLSKPVRSIQKNNDAPVICIPVKKLLSAIGYTYSWDKKKQLLTIQKTDFFTWESSAYPSDTSLNHIYKASGAYETFDQMAFLDLYFYGDLQSSFDSVTVNRTDATISIKLPASQYLLEKKTYDRFGEIVKTMSITESDSVVTIVFDCENTTEFTYTTVSNVLHLRLLWDYSSLTGKTTDYSLTFLRPSENYYINNVSHQECYDAVKYKKAFEIILKGDHVDFYRKNPVIINNNKVKKIKISLNSDLNTVIRVTTKSLQGYRIERLGENFVVTLGSPKKIYKNILVLDAGHGDYDNGASHYGYYEKRLNLKMIYTLIKKYFSKTDCETHVYWTRRSDKFVTLDARAKFAAKVGADAFISLHMNSATSTSACGTEVYYSTDNNKYGFSGIRSADMAIMMKKALVSAMGTDDRGVRTAGFYVIKNNSVPAILIELGFLSNKKDMEKLTDPEHQKTASITIKDTITEIFNTFPTGR